MSTKRNLATDSGEKDFRNGCGFVVGDVAAERRGIRRFDLHRGDGVLRSYRIGGVRFHFFRGLLGMALLPWPINTICRHTGDARNMAAIAQLGLRGSIAERELAADHTDQ